MPQMMPLPWLMVFLMIFICVYSVFLYMSPLFSFTYSSVNRPFKTSSVELPW